MSYAGNYPGGQQHPVPYYYSNAPPPGGQGDQNHSPDSGGLPPYSHGKQEYEDVNENSGKSKPGKPQQGPHPGSGYYPGASMQGYPPVGGGVPPQGGNWPHPQGQMYQNQQYGAPMAGIPPNYQQQNHGPAYSMGYGAQQPEKNKERNRGMLTGCLAAIAFCCCLDCLSSIAR